MSTAKLEEGGWTPALRQMSLELLDSYINRPPSAVISDPRQSLSFHAIREKITKRKYNQVQEYADDINAFFKHVIETGDELQKDIAEDYQQSFQPRIDELIELSHFKFRTMASKICDDIDAIKKEAEALDA